MPYVSKVDHRDNTARKSQWTITFNDEKNCYDHAAASNWIEPPTIGWGLHIGANGVPSHLGISAAIHGEHRQLFIAKFIDGNGNDVWHGYPADPYRNSQDIPPERVLGLWVQGTLLRPAIARKLNRGQKCDL